MTMEDDTSKWKTVSPFRIFWEDIRTKIYLRLYKRKIASIIATAQANVYADARRRGVPESLEGYRHKFRDVPLGRWNSSFEYGPWPTYAWEFYADGTGKYFTYAGSGDEESQFEWRSGGERTIQIRITDWGYEEDAAAAEEEEEPWFTIQYDFKTIEHYTTIIVMYQIPEAEHLKFWLTPDYLQFEGDLAALSVHGLP